MTEKMKLSLTSASSKQEINEETKQASHKCSLYHHHHHQLCFDGCFPDEPGSACSSSVTSSTGV